MGLLLSGSINVLVKYVFSVYWNDRLAASEDIVGTIGSLLMFSLVFRTQSCYQRWWEARCAWGKMISGSNVAAQEAICWIQSECLQDRFLAYLIVLPYAMKAILRGKSLGDEKEEGGLLVKKGMLSEEELDNLCRQDAHTAYYCVEMMRSFVYYDVGKREGNPVMIKIFEDTFRALMSAQGVMNRLNNTGLPPMYNTFMTTLIVTFVIVANLCWSVKYSWYALGATAILTFILSTLVTVGNGMLKCFDDKQVFGTVLTIGLPLEKYCALIEKNVHAIYRRRISNEEQILALTHPP
mmetsp:Transcript_31396/g.71820  ORF Transcript_31396/g.71820 Transcript_31396/m.71820 type:complete len:295 (+) Transcript_31396:319-1203(+)